jgi:ABC-2 type transport system permease protein
MSAAFAIARITIRQVLGVRRLIGLGLLALAPSFILFLSTSQQTDRAALQNFIDLSAGLFYNVVIPVITLILTSASLGDERRDGTLSFLVLRPQPRWLIAVAKILGAAGSAMVICAVGGVLMATVYGLRTEFWEYVWPMIVGSLLASAAYAAIFVPLGYITERAVAIGLAYVFIWEQGIVAAVGSLATLSPWRIGYAAFAALIPVEAQRLVPEFALGTLRPGFGGSAIKAVVFLAVSVVLTSMILTRRDLT